MGEEILMKALIIDDEYNNKEIPGTQIPKGLKKYKGKYILQRLVEKLKDINIDDITIIIGHYGSSWTKKNIDKITKICPKVIVNIRNDDTGATYSLCRYLKIDNQDEDILILDGGLIAYEDCLDKLSSFYNKTTILTKDMKWHKHDFSFVYTKFHKVYNIGKYIYSPKATAFANSLKLSKNDIKYVKKVMLGLNKRANIEKLINEMLYFTDIYEYRTGKWFL
jgi:choline kinase